MKRDFRFPLYNKNQLGLTTCLVLLFIFIYLICLLLVIQLYSDVYVFMYICCIAPRLHVDSIYSRDTHQLTTSIRQRNHLLTTHRSEQHCCM